MCFLKIKHASVCARRLFGMRQFIALNRTPWWCSISSRKNREKEKRQARSLSLMGTPPRAAPTPAPGLITRKGKKGGTWGEAEGTKREGEMEREGMCGGGGVGGKDGGTTNHWSHSATTGHSHTALFNLYFSWQFLLALSFFLPHLKFDIWQFDKLILTLAQINSARQLSTEGIVKWQTTPSFRISSSSLKNNFSKTWFYENVSHVRATILFIFCRWIC